MITSQINQKRGLNRFSKLPDDGDPLEPNNLLKPGAKEKHQLSPGGPRKKKLDCQLRFFPPRCFSRKFFLIVPFPDHCLR